ncbi:MAG: transglycosylase SLT domain-containing protein [Bdellovibrionales bacterium]|nr:transglycosylase SLT domain-containing protein [Bdellovibrionales bacterium]
MRRLTQHGVYQQQRRFSWGFGTRGALVLCSLLLSACATAPADEAHYSPGAPIASPTAYRREPDPQAPATARTPASDRIRTARAAPIPPDRPYQGMRVAGVRLRRTDFDLPVRVNAKVEKWVRYFTGRGREHFERWLERAEYMAPEILPILRRESLPEDLLYLSLIESGFSFHATSHADAVGPWQFISGTGRRFGLRIDWWLDERRDVRKSTRAAARYLSELYRQFGSWELAAAGYNAGENRVERALRETRTRDYWSLIRRPRLSRETREYVPKLFAAAIIGKNRQAYGFRASYSRPGAEDAWHGDTLHVRVDGPVDLLKVARAAGLAYQELKRLNPELLRWCSPPGVDSVSLRLPASARDRFQAAYHHPEFARSVDFRSYRVRPGDTLARIARRFGVRVEPLQELNGLSPYAFLREGAELRLPLPADRVFSTVQASAHADASTVSALTLENREAARAASRVEGI